MSGISASGTPKDSSNSAETKKQQSQKNKNILEPTEKEV